jgi:hypothetical protein
LRFFCTSNFLVLFSLEVLILNPLTFRQIIKLRMEIYVIAIK